MNYDEFRRKKGFIVALDQSGGNQTLSSYGIYNYNKEDLFYLMHSIRKRIIKSRSFTSDKILGCILSEEEVFNKIDDNYVVDYLLDKNIATFVKIDKGLLEKKDGVRLMKNITNLDETLNKLNKMNIFGTKMRSVIYENNVLGISKLVKQQFDLAKIVWAHGLIPILEPEVDIHSLEKEECEMSLKLEIDKQLRLLKEEKIILKLSLPSIDNFYDDYVNDSKILKVLALSGGYNRNNALEILSKNKGVYACFSRAFIEGLRINQTDDKFDSKLEKIVDDIYVSSVK